MYSLSMSTFRTIAQISFVLWVGVFSSNSLAQNDDDSNIAGDDSLAVTPPFDWNYDKCKAGGTPEDICRNAYPSPAGENCETKAERLSKGDTSILVQLYAACMGTTPANIQTKEEKEAALKEKADAIKEKAKKEKDDLKRSCSKYVNEYNKGLNDQKAFCSVQYTAQAKSCSNLVDTCNSQVNQAEEQGLWKIDPQSNQMTAPTLTGPCRNVLDSKTSDKTAELYQTAKKELDNAKDMVDKLKSEGISSDGSDIAFRDNYDSKILQGQNKIESDKLKLQSDISKLRAEKNKAFTDLSAQIRVADSERERIENDKIPKALAELRSQQAEGLAKCTAESQDKAQAYNKSTGVALKASNSWASGGLQMLVDQKRAGVGTEQQRLSFYEDYFKQRCLEIAQIGALKIAQLNYDSQVASLKQDAKDADAKKALLIQQQINIVETEKNNEDDETNQARLDVITTQAALNQAYNTQLLNEENRRRQAALITDRLSTYNQKITQYNQQLAVLPATSPGTQNYDNFRKAQNAQSDISSALTNANSDLCCDDSKTGGTLFSSSLGAVTIPGQPIEAFCNAVQHSVGQGYVGKKAPKGAR